MDKTYENVSKSRFGRGLLATTCLTVASGVSAIAGTITEGTAPAPIDFDNLPNGFQLPVGTTLVFGQVGSLPNEGGFDNVDWFEFLGLGSGTYTLTGTGVDPQGSFFSDVKQDDGTLLAENGFFGGGSFAISGTIPVDGKLVVGVFQAEEVGGNYSVALSTQSTAPEPSTLIPAGLALAGALAWRRKRSQ